jgi:LPS-assembly protein
MITYLFRIFPAIIFLSLFVTSTCEGEDLARSGAVVLHADSLTYRKADDTYRALGNVHLDWDDLKLVADSALLRQSDNTADAEGSIVLTTDGDILHADRMSVNLVNQNGEITNGSIFMKRGNFHILGKKMSKTGPEDYHIETGSFTPCDGDVPSWKFSASSIDVTLGEYATGKNVLFYIRDVPILYLPYIVFPLKTERQSGFLLPKPGTSTKGGFIFNIPYYWAISQSQDVTFNLDIQSKRGAGTGVDYRYIRKTGSEGTFRGYLIYDTSTDKIRGDLSEKHQEDFSPTLSFKSDVNYVSDRNFYRDFAEGFGEYNRKSVDSNVFLTKHWQRFLLTPEVRFSQDLESTSNTATFQKLPILNFTGINQRLGATPFYVTLDSNFTNFYREQGFQGQRLDLHPTLFLYTNPASWLESTAWAGYQHRFYNMYGGTGSSSFDDIGLFNAGMSMSSPLTRIYQTGGKGMSGLRHILIPEIGYVYVQNREQGELPFFDYNDRVVHRNAIRYSLSNYLTGKFADGNAPATYRQLAFFKLSQEYDFSGSRRDLLTPYDELRPFSDIWIEARVNPTQKISLLVDSRYNPYHTNFSTNNLAVKYDSEVGTSVKVSYRFARTQEEYLEGILAINLLKPFVLNFAGRYSLNSGAFLESNYSIEYKQQCWSIIFSYGEHQGNKGFFVNFVLAGIGPISKVPVF